LDSDSDFIKYTGGAPDFHPRLIQFCTLDQDVAKQHVQDLIDQIQGNSGTGTSNLAKTMTQAFIGLYQGVIQRYKNQINAVPPPSQAQIAALNAAIAPLQSNVKILKQFLKTLP
jgi:polyhydroxyalkanoate synthesis regulator phasin